MDTTELVGNLEAAALLDISRTNFCHMRRKREEAGWFFPTPVAELACGPVWRRADMEAFKRIYYRQALTARELLIERIEQLSDDEVDIVLALVS